MERRDFIKKSTAAGITGPAIIKGLYANNLFESSTGVAMNIDIPSPYLNKLVVKPIIASMYHTDEWEGPCRFNVKSMAEEKTDALRSFENFSNAVKNGKYDKSVVEFQEPAQILFVEDFKISEEEYNKIEADAKNADVLYLDPAGSSVCAYDIAMRFNKPLVLSMGLNCRTVDISAYCRSHGLECFIPNSFEETKALFTLLKARKIFKQTRILFPTNWGWPSVASISGINEPEKLKVRLVLNWLKFLMKILPKKWTGQRVIRC